MAREFAEEAPCTIRSAIPTSALDLQEAFHTPTTTQAPALMQLEHILTAQPGGCM